MAEEAVPCLLQLQVLGSSCMPPMPSAAPSGALQEWGEEQSLGERGGCWSSLPSVLGNSIHGELSLQCSGFPPALPRAGWRLVTCWPVPSGTSPLHHFLQAGNVTCKQSGKAGAGLGSHAPRAPGPALAPVASPCPKTPSRIWGREWGAALGEESSWGWGDGDPRASSSGEEAVGMAVTRLLCALALP